MKMVFVQSVLQVVVTVFKTNTCVNNAITFLDFLLPYPYLFFLESAMWILSLHAIRGTKCTPLQPPPPKFWAFIVCYWLVLRHHNKVIVLFLIVMFFHNKCTRFLNDFRRKDVMHAWLNVLNLWQNGRLRSRAHFLKTCWGLADDFKTMYSDEKPNWFFVRP